ncbi:MAG: hypothetical protein HC909_03015 [Blastochloris sp.]|nr:hypothetical protein [Blastochloris sp.]
MQDLLCDGFFLPAGKAAAPRRRIGTLRRRIGTLRRWIGALRRRSRAFGRCAGGGGHGRLLIDTMSPAVHPV